MADGVLSQMSFPFSGGMTADISDRILQLPLLKRIENCRYVRSGGLVSANLFHTFGSPPVTTGGIFRILNHNEELFTLGASTTGLTGVLKYNESQSQWNGVNGYSGCNIKMWDIAQRERDLREVGICAWTDSIYIFYAEPSILGGGRVFYKSFSFRDGEEPEVSIERECLTYQGNITGLFAHNPRLDYDSIDNCPESLNRVILIVSTTENAYFNYFKPSKDNSFDQNQEIKNEVPAQKNLSYFFLYRNTLFYKASMTDSDGRLIPTGNVLSIGIDGQPVVPSGDYPGGIESGFTYPYDDVTAFENYKIFNFREWTKFSIGNRDFKVLWTPTTGYWIINSFDEITGHFLSDAVPFGFDETNNMRSLIHPAKLEINGQERVFFPVLKSGQPEQRGESLEYPLGISLVEVDFNWRNRQDRLTSIGKQGLLTGGALHYFNGIDLVEYGFAEKPRIKKTASEDYDQWPFGDLLEKELPTLSELTPDQFTLFDTAINKLDSPYTVVDNTLTANFVDANDEQGGTWKNDVPANRALRYSSNIRDGTVDKAYSGVLSRVYWKKSESALIVEFTTVPSSLDSGFSHPQGVLINSKLYEFQDETLTAGTLVCRHLIDENPLTSGNDYIIKIASTNTLTSPDTLNAVVRTAQTNPARKEIRCVNTSFRRFRNRTLLQTMGITELNVNSNVSFGVLRRDTINKRVLVTPAVAPQPERTERVPGGSSNLTISLENALYTDPITIWKAGDDIAIGSDWIGGNSLVITRHETNTFGNYLQLERPETYGTRIHHLVGDFIRGGYSKGIAIGSSLVYMKSGSSLHAYGTTRDTFDDETPLHLTARPVRLSAKDISLNASVGFFVGNNVWLYASGSWRVYNTSGSGVTSVGTATGVRIPTGGKYVINGNDVFVFSWSNGLRWTGYRISGLNVTSLGSGSVLGVSFLNNSYLRGPYRADLGITPGTIYDDVFNGRFYSASGNFIAFNWQRRDHRGTTDTIYSFIKIDSITSPNPSRTTPATPGRAAVYETRPTLVNGPQGFIKSGYKSKLSIPSDFVEAGTASSPNITDDIEFTGLYADSQDGSVRSNLYVYFSTDSNRYVNPGALDSALRTEPATQISKIKFKVGSREYIFNTSTLAAGDVNQYTSTPTKSIRWNLRGALSSSALLRTIINLALGGQSLSISFQRDSGTLFQDIQTTVKPHIFSAVFRTDSVLTPNTVETDVISSDIVVLDPANDAVSNSLKLPESSLKKIKGPDPSKHYYYKKTTDNPLSFSPFLFNFSEPLNSLSFRYVLVETAVRAEDLLRARVYKYKTRYKWIDSLGIEHRSRDSDIITLLANSDFGEGDNSPTFEIENLHLSEKNDDSIAIEIYRTEKNTDNFRLVGEILNNKISDISYQIFTDNVKDNDLGQADPPSNTTIAGASNCISYKGRYILYGFPEKQNRLVVSSPIREFVNESISFKLEGTPQDFIEILMEDAIQCIRPLDQFIVIFTKDRAYSWSINETTASQPYPVEITGFKELSAVNSHSITEVQNGLLFLTNKGFWGISRGKAPYFIGKDIQDFNGDVLDTLNVAESEESFISTTDPRYPLINYNHRFGKFSVLKRFNVLSMTNWKGRWIGINDRSRVVKDFTPTDLQLHGADNNMTPFFQDLILETGWINVSQIQHYQRVTKIFLLAKFEHLKSLTYDLRINFKEGPVLKNEDVPGVSDWETKTQWVLDMDQYRQSSAIKVRIHAQAASGEFDALLLNYRVSPGVYLNNSNLNIQTTPQGSAVNTQTINN